MTQQQVLDRLRIWQAKHSATLNVTGKVLVAQCIRALEKDCQRSA